MFSLTKIAYMTSNDEERDAFDSKMGKLTNDIKQCCVAMLNYYRTHRRIYISEMSESELRKVRKWTAMAAENGHLDCLEFAVKSGFPLTAEVSANAGEMECLAYVCEQGGEVDATATHAAAANGQLDCLEYLHRRDVPWNEFTCDAANYHGHMDCLGYAKKHGCPWN